MIRWHASRRLARSLCGLLLLCAAALPAAAQITLRDDGGHTLQLAAPPARIVSLVPSLTESVCALGECSRLVGTDRSSNWPRSVLALPKLGGLGDAQLERIVALAPDLLLATPSERIVSRLRALGIPVLVLNSNSHADVKRNLQLLGRVFGEPQQARSLWSQIQQQLDEAAARVPPAMRERSVYFEVDAGPYAAAPASFIGETLQGLGLRNITPESLGPFPKLSPEFIVRAQPQIIIADERSLREMAARPGWSSLLALQQQQVCRFDTAQFERLVRPGPRLGEAALSIAACLVRLDEGAR